ncbi:hypothetical protein [Streptomyces sp. NPDC048438]|uniref:hypothetical protein n=1 Tax=Streptomyces sp. NPDC048438 TaxID=3365551 RepID=UPI0037219F84
MLRAIMGVDYSLVIAAAQAAGPCPPGEEVSWGHRVHTLTVDLHMIAKQAAQDVDRLESAKRSVALLEKVEIEETSRRGLVTLRPQSGEAENIRAEQEETDRGHQLIEQARSLVDPWLPLLPSTNGSSTPAESTLAHTSPLGIPHQAPPLSRSHMAVPRSTGPPERLVAAAGALETSWRPAFPLCERPVGS